MAEPHLCGRCGAVLPGGSPDGVCPGCLLKLGLPGTDPDAMTSVPGAPAARAEAGPATHPERIGPYRILEVLGQGGMGIVYRAEQEYPIRRIVALKLIKLGMDTREVVARFESERQALALMTHPNIARVLDAGASEQGRPYFVMEYVAGVPISEYCDRNRLTNRERLILFVRVCHAIQHAHQKGVIHRDLKPSNVLVTVEDGVPVPKVIDFGIAKAVRQRLSEKTFFTRNGVLVGTPEYMSPEQADMRAGEVDTTTDIYSLGVMLYELLVGALPFDAERLRQAGYTEILRMIREDEPARPSQRITGLGVGAEDVATRRHTTLPSLQRQLRGELDWIVLKALEKDPTRRYASASEFAADVDRHLSDEPVLASPPSAIYQLKKTFRKHRAAVAGTAAVVVALLAGLAVATAMYVRSERARVETERQRAIATEQTALARTMYSRSEASRAETERQRGVADDQRVQAQRAQSDAEAQRTAADGQSYFANIAAADLLLRSNQIAEARKRLAAAPPALRGWEWQYLYAESDPSLATLGSGGGAVTSISFTPDGSSLVWVADRGVLRGAARQTFLPLADVRRPSGGIDRPESVVAVSADGSKYVAAAWTLPVAPALYMRVAGKPEGHVPERDEANLVSGTVTAEMTQGYPTGRTPLSDPPVPPLEQRTLSVTDAASGATISRLVLPTCGVSAPVRPSVQTVQIREKGQIREVNPTLTFDVSVDTFAVADSAGHTLATLSGRPGSVVSAAFSTDGQRVVAWSWDNVLRVFDAATGTSIATLAGHEDGVTQAVFDHAGSQVVSSSHDGSVRVWSVAGAAEPRILKGHDGAVHSVAFSPDGRLIASGGADGTVRLWTVGGVALAILKGHDGPVMATAFSADGRRLASGSRDKTIRLWDVATRRQVAELRGHAGDITALAFSADGRQLASGSADNTVKVWDARRVRVVPADPAVAGSQVRGVGDLHADSGRVVAASAQGGALQWWDLDSPDRFTTLGYTPSGPGPRAGPGITLYAASLSPDGRRAVSGAVDGTVKVWSLETGLPLAALAGPKRAAVGVTMSPDGTRVAAAFADNTILVWPVGGGKPVTMTAPAMPRWGPRFSPDGRRLAAAADRTVTIWDVGSGTVVWRTPQLPTPITTFAFSPDGQRIAVGCQDRTMNVWTIGSGQAARTLAGDAIGWPLTFDASGARLVAPYDNGRLRLWDARSFRALLQLDVGAGPPQRAAFTNDGRRLLLLGNESTIVVFDARTSYAFDGRQVVDQLFDQLRLTADVIAALKGDSSLAPVVRDAAIRLARARGDDPMELFGASQAIAWSPGHTDADYRRAVRYAEAAAREVPSSARFAELFGLALYRVGRYRESVAAFRRADSIRGGPDLPGMIFLAMALNELGDEAQAQAAANEFAAYVERRQQIPWNTFEAGWWGEIKAYKQALDQAAAAKKK